MIYADTAVGKLNRIGFAKQDHAGPVKLLDRMGICSGNIFFEKTCSGSRRQSPDVKQIFDGIGDTVQNTGIFSISYLPVRRGRLFQGPFRTGQPEGIQSTIQ